MHHVQGSVLTLGGDPFETAAEPSDTVAQKRAVSRIMNVSFLHPGRGKQSFISYLNPPFWGRDPRAQRQTRTDRRRVEGRSPEPCASRAGATVRSWGRTLGIRRPKGRL